MSSFALRCSSALVQPGLLSSAALDLSLGCLGEMEMKIERARTLLSSSLGFKISYLAQPFVFSFHCFSCSFKLMMRGFV